MLSRFDLVYLILDKADKDLDSKLARNIVKSFFVNAATVPKPAHAGDAAPSDSVNPGVRVERMVRIRLLIT